VSCRGGTHLPDAAPVRRDDRVRERAGRRGARGATARRRRASGGDRQPGTHRLLQRANELAGDLRLLDRKRLELARALACRPRLLLLDEIAGGLTDAELPELIGIVREVRDGGTAVVWIEHIVHALVEVVDRMLCLASGAVLATGAPDAVLPDAGVREVYLGAGVEGLERA
jgi:branched-chain amino acid transport system ATP-binding protein